MDIYGIKVPPALLEFLLDAGGKTSIMPSDSSPTDRALHTVPGWP
jgi:hypothetical protein